MTGIILRLRQYLTGRSLWADEAMLTLNIVNRTMGGLFKPLDYDQGAPIGFLLIEKIFNLLFSKNEYSLRLFPLAVGIASLWLFYLLLKRTTSAAGLVTALALFVLNPRLIYYSSEVKQYIIDAAIMIGLLLTAAPLFEAKPQKRDFAILAGVGFIALWFSHPALFVLAGIGLTLLIIYLQRQDYINLRYAIGTGMVWLITIGFLYILILNDLQQNAYMREYWWGGFFPVPPWSDPSWFGRSINENIGIQFGIPYATYFVFILVLIGWVWLWMQYRNYAIAVGLIFLITLTASAFKLYPIFERMILFTVPIGLILIGKSVEFFSHRLSNQRWLNGFVTLTLAGYLLYGPFTTSLDSFLNPKYFEHIRPSMQFLHDTWQDGDSLFVTNGAIPAFEYYAPTYRLAEISYVSTRREAYKNNGEILEQLDALKGQSRVWILMSHVYEKDGFNERDFILDYLKQIGQRKRSFQLAGTSVYLYLYDLK